MPVIALDHVQLTMPAGAELQARNFYGTLLGLPEIAKPQELASRGGAWFQCGGIQIHLGVENSFRPAQKAHPAFLVQQFDDLVARLRREGFEITEDTSLPTVTRAFTNDPFGNRIELIASHAAA